MIYISVPVHEAPEVIVDQIFNITKFIPNGCIILHVSKQASFSKDKLNKIFDEKKINNVLINPISVDTSWGSIIQSHISNVKYIDSISSNKNDKVIFHASNDMIVRNGLDSFLSNSSNLFHTRYYERSGYWWPANVALNQDKIFLDVLRRVGTGRIVASQIEGSMYQIRLLNEIIKLIDKYEIIGNNKAFYPREEFYFSSFAYALGVIPDNTPYVYSEVHYFDMVLWKIFNKIDNSCIPFKNTLKKHINTFLFKSQFYKIKEQTVDSIISSEYKKIEIYDGGNYWNPYPDNCGLYGVKRIHRNMNDKIRNYINSVTNKQ
ncbi:MULTISPECIES: hypothetical protein [unclassified Gilliamella]|uniref:hypothetical protein n=1 Tax=unclassified Gilliamella TaxID=2685620 RepID=UPI001326A7E6|nr:MULTISPECIES: hypothetical protein [unclassified Gilliamella]MWN31260.1 hypothetical protein [Gilliamella sp. Pra-s60]MWP29899.1 hypothetical protein [Gilliamella sp. Pra-s54]